MRIKKSPGSRGEGRWERGKEGERCAACRLSSTPQSFRLHDSLLGSALSAGSHRIHKHSAQARCLHALCVHVCVRLCVRAHLRVYARKRLAPPDFGLLVANHNRKDAFLGRRVAVLLSAPPAGASISTFMRREVKPPLLQAGSRRAERAGCVCGVGGCINHSQGFSGVCRNL